MKLPTSFKPSPALFRRSAVVLAAILLLALISALALPSFLKNQLEQQVQAQTGRQFTVGAVAFNPFTLRVSLTQLQLLEADNKTPAFSADGLSVRLSAASLLHLAPVIGDVTLSHPSLRLVRSMQGGKEVTNFSDIMERFAQQPSSGAPLRFSVSNIQLINGAVELDDKIAGKKVHIEALQLGVPFLSDFPTAQDVYILPHLSARVDGALVELKARSKPFSDAKDTSLAIDIDHFNLVGLTAFAPTLLPFQLKAATLSTNLTLSFCAKKDQQKISLSGSAALADVALNSNAGAPLYRASQVKLILQDADLVQRHIAVTALDVVDPEVWVGLDQHGVLNWSALQKKQSAQEPATKPEAGATRVELTRLQIRNGTVHWSDAANATPAMEAQLVNIALDVGHISNMPQAAPAQIKLSAEGSQTLHFDGLGYPVLGQLSGQLSVSALALQDYQPYFNRVLAAAVSGNLAVQTRLEIKDGNFSARDLSLALDDLVLQASNRANGRLAAKKIALDGVAIEGAGRQVQIDQVTLDQVQGDVFRAADGELNLNHLIKKVAASSPRPSGTPWQAEIRQVALTGSSFNFGDKSMQPAVRLRADAVDLKLENISSRLDHPVKVALRATLNKTGKFNVNGTATAKTAQMNLDVQNFAVAALQPYFTDFLNINISQGSVSTKARLKWKAPAEISYQGGLKIANLATTDKENADDFLKWKLLEISGINVALGGAAPSVALGKINLNDFYARVILSEKGRLNLQNIMAHATQTGSGSVVAVQSTVTPAVAAPHAEPVISVGQINLNNGIINYTDNFIKPHYSMRMTGMKGSVGEIHSNLAQAAPINLNGKVDDEAPIAISGSLNPLFSPMLLDVRLTASGVDLPRLTSYALKYAGYPIVKGKLSLDVDYHIKDNQLAANNALKLDQLTFGDKVDGPDATHLPVPFLVSLLTDSNGQINLDLPISGTLNDPQFSIGGLIVKVLFNLLGKIVTSPFTMLAHALGGSGGETLSYIGFQTGSATLDDASKAKMDSLAKALEQHPALKLDIIGRADAAADSEGLRQASLTRKIRQINNLDAGDERALSAAERARAIDKIYSAAKFDKPRNFIGLAKSLPTAEMEKLILANTNIGEDDLRNLALNRESAVNTYLRDVDHIGADRLFSIAPKLSGDGIADKGPISRVDFDLKM